MNALIAWWARNPIAANLLMLGMICTGLLGYAQIDREIIPAIKFKVVEVTIQWPGASPREVEEQLVVRIEETLKDLDNIDKLTSIAAQGVGKVIITATPQTDIGAFINRVKLRVDSIASFPRDIEPPIVRVDVLRTPVVGLAVHGNASELELKRIAQDLREQIAVLPSIAIVQLSGVRQEEVSIELSAQSMRRYGLSFDQVANAIRNNSINLSAGQVETSTGDIQLRTNNFAQSQTDFNNIIIRQNEDGGQVTVADVATVIDGFEEEPLHATFEGKPAVRIEVMTSEKVDVVKISELVRQWMEDSKPHLPQGVEVSLMFDALDTYKGRMSMISNSALSGLVLVFLVLLLSLRPKIALWVTFGIATAYAASFSLLPANGVSINIFSTFAFLLVLGIVVDDAIVVGESIHEQSNPDGSGGTENAILGTQLVAKPVLFAVLTSIIGFMPWLFLNNEDTQVIKQIAVVISLALTFSLVEAFFILPAHLRKLEPRSNKSKWARVQHAFEQSLNNFAEKYIRRMLHLVLRNAYFTASLFIGMFIISVGLITSGWVKFAFTPDLQKDVVVFNVNMAQGTDFERVMEVVQQIEQAENRLEGAVKIKKEIPQPTEPTQDADSEEQTEPEPKYEYIDGVGRLGENRYTLAQQENISVTIKLADPDYRATSAKDTAKMWRELVGEIPDADKISVEYSSNQQPGLSYSISHPDLDKLTAAVDDFKEQLKTYDAVYDVRDNLQSVTQELHFSLLPGAKRLGLTLAEINKQVRQAYYGEEAQRLPRHGSDVKVMVRYPYASRTTLESLSDFRVRTADGHFVPLLSVVSIEYRSGVLRIDRTEGQRSAEVTAELSDNIGRQIQSDLEKNFIPEWQKRHPGASYGEVGEAEGQKEFAIQLMSLYFVAMFLMYAIIAVAFKSYTLPFVIMIAIPFGFVGAVYGHIVYGMSMTLFSYFGIGAAGGVVINDNLVLIDYINRMRDKGLDWFDAVVEAGVRRFRPIVLTSLTTFVGLLPMMAEKSVQAKFMQPTVIALAFGVLTAGIVTMLLVPAIYAIREDIMEEEEDKKQDKEQDDKQQAAIVTDNH